jgi:hypothetical protein
MSKKILCFISCVLGGVFAIWAQADDFASKILKASQIAVGEASNDWRLGIITLDKDFVELASVQNFLNAASDPDAKIMLVSLPDSTGEPIELGEEEYVVLKSWYPHFIRKGGIAVNVVELIKGDEPRSSLLISTRISRDKIDLEFPMRALGGSQWLVAVKPLLVNKDELNISEEDLEGWDDGYFYELYGHALFSAIPTVWPERIKYPPYFDGVMSDATRESLIALIESKGGE